MEVKPSPASQTGDISPRVSGAKPRISFDFKDADLKNVLRLLADLSGTNIVVTEEVQKKITLRLVDVPWDRALEVLLRSNGLVQEKIGEVIWVSSPDQITAQRERLRAALESRNLLEPLETVVITVNYASVTDLAKKLEPTLSQRGSAVPDTRTNTILLRDTASAVRAATLIVGRMDTRPPQVLIESNIIETTPTFARSLGTQLRFTVPTDPRSADFLFPRTGALGTSPTTEGELERSVPGLFPGGASLDSNALAGAPFIPGGLGGTLAIIQNRAGAFRNLSALLTAAEEKGELKIISRPSVVTLNNVQSTIQSLRVVRVALPEGSTNIASGTGAAAGSAVATEQIPVGITLSVAPQVSSDGFILLNIKVKTSELGGVSFGAAVPDEITREAISNVMIRDGETVVIGGIMKNTRQKRESGVPFLKEIPVLGWFFKRESLRDDFEELMVFITPRIVHRGGKDLPDAEKLWRRTLSKTRGPGITLPHSRP